MSCVPRQALAAIRIALFVFMLSLRAAMLCRRLAGAPGSIHTDGVLPASSASANAAVLGGWLIALLAGVAHWSGWVGLGSLCGSGMVEPLPGIGGEAGILGRLGGFGWRLWPSVVVEG